MSPCPPGADWKVNFIIKVDHDILLYINYTAMKNIKNSKRSIPTPQNKTTFITIIIQIKLITPKKPLGNYKNFSKKKPLIFWCNQIKYVNKERKVDHEKKEVVTLKLYIQICHLYLGFSWSSCLLTSRTTHTFCRTPVLA